MDCERFRNFSVHFIDHVKNVCGPKEARGVQLLIIDGHSSRLQGDVLLNLAREDIIVYCLPSHTTHRTQPNDSGVNRSWKSQLRQKLEWHVISGNEINFSVIARAAHDVHYERDDTMKKSIINSFKHTGIEPLDISRIDTLVARENVREIAKADWQVLQAVELAREFLSKLNSFRNLAEKDRAEARRLARARDNIFSTEHGTVLNNMWAIEQMEIRKMITGINSLPAEQLRLKMRTEMGFSAEDLLCESKTKKGVVKMKPKTVETLKGMIHVYVAEQALMHKERAEKWLSERFTSGMAAFDDAVKQGGAAPPEDAPPGDDSLDLPPGEQRMHD